MAENSEDRSKKRPRTDEAETEPELQVVKEYNDPTADVTLISSDRYVFKVHSYRLKSVSSVFQSTFELGSKFDQGGQVRIVLTDPEIENNGIIKEFLDLIYDEDVFGLFEVTYRVTAALRLLRFIDKYDCSALRKAMRFSLAYQIFVEDDRDLPDPFDLFAVAAQLDDVNLAVKAINIAEDVEVDVALARGRVEEITLEEYSNLPPKYAFALMQGVGSEKLVGEQSSTKRCRIIAERFKEVMVEYGEDD